MGNERPLRYDWPAWAPIYIVVGLSLFHGLVPFGISLLASRHGWFSGHPGAWNRFGLLPVGAGVAVIMWTIRLHKRGAMTHGWRYEPTPFEPAQYLILSGPYRYTRNPIFLSHLTIWGGWAIYYGSIAMLVGVVLMWVVLAFVVIPYEESGLVRQLGEPYLRYQQQVGRWFGRGA